MCKCANVQKPSVHKMRKSAAQIFFQMQKSQICTVHKNANATFCTCHNFVCASGVHSLCTCVGFGCARCAQCAECPEPWRRFSASVCEVCAHLQNVSDSVAELDAPRNPFDDSDELCACQEKTAPDRISARGAKAKPAPNPGAFSVRGRPGADLAGFGQIWRPGGYSN